MASLNNKDTFEKAKRRAAARKAALLKATERLGKSTKGDGTYEEVQKLKKAGKFFGFDGMKGQTGPGSNLPGK